MPKFFLFFFLVYFLVLPCAWGGEEKPATKPDAATIDKLVKQLGSKNFAEREKATKALEGIGFPALDALRAAAKSKDNETAQRAARLVAIIENGFDQLLADYRGYGLPLPPKDAKLVKFVSGGGGIVNDEITPLTYFFGFLLQPRTKDKPPLLLVGTQELPLDPGTKFQVVEPKPELVKKIDPHLYWQSTFEMNAGLAVALQCKSRGWNDLARELWTASIKESCGHHFGAFFQPANLPNRTAVAYLAWAYYANELVKPDTDRVKIAKQIKTLLAAEPMLNTPDNRAFLGSLEAALVPSKAKAGTVERLVDDLTEGADTSHLRSKGFAAVPALIDHLDDDRLTRSASRGFNNFPPHHLRVKELASGLLQELAGEDVGRDWLQRQKGWAVDKADAQDWWKHAQKIGEEAYFVARVLPKGERGEFPNSLMLEFITKKYPQHLSKIYKTILDERPKLQSWTVAKAIGESSLPAEKKLELFLYASRHKNLLHRRSGLDGLQKLDPQKFMQVLLATLESLPKSPKEPYWRCPEAAYVHLVMLTDDARAWQMLEKVAKQSDVGLRMEFMNPMNYTYVGDKQRKQRLAFLAAFLDDAEAPNVKANPKMFDGPHAGFTFDRLEVRDLAAMKIASILGMPDQPDKKWTPQQWEKLRTKVKEAMKR